LIASQTRLVAAAGRRPHQLVLVAVCEHLVREVRRCGTYSTRRACLGSVQVVTAAL